MTLQTQSSREALALLMDPMLFFVPVIFLLGAGLFVLRIFPTSCTSCHGSRDLSGRILDTDDQTTRPQRQAIYSLLLLLIVTVALGIYSAAAARTLSRNFEDRIMYAIGADAVLLSSGLYQPRRSR